MQAERVVPALFTADEACAFLGIKKTKLYNLINDETLPSTKLGGRRMFRWSDLEEYVNALFEEGTA